MTPSWLIRHQRLAELSARQLFFIGGAPRSGTTWLQQMLDAHPAISCRGEALFMKHLSEPIDALIAQRRTALDAKARAIFKHTGGYPLPTEDDADYLIGAAILLALDQQEITTNIIAIGEKTPENVFLFPRLKRIFPAAKFIAIARDPRDVLTSAWHFFHRAAPGEDELAAKTEFIKSAIPSLEQGARAMLAFAAANPADTAIVTYDGLQRNQPAILAFLFNLLGVANDEPLVADCIACTAFATQTSGRAPGVEDQRAFFRKGIVGDWRGTLPPVLNDLMLQELGWIFPTFGWTA